MSAGTNLLKLVPDETRTIVNVIGQLVHLCPHVPETDVGTVEITWQCGGMTVELHSLTSYLASWADQLISSEEITSQIEADLETLDGIDVLSVETAWVTAGMKVRIAT